MSPQSSKKVHALATEFERDLRTRIEAYEKRTSVEFVPVLLAQAQDYATDFFLSLTRLTLGIGWIIALYAPPEWRHLAIEAPMAFVVAGLVIMKTPFLLRLFVSRRSRQAAVARRAQEVFFREEIFQTKNRTGVLILVSEFERTVFLLADKELLAKFPAERWQELGVMLARNFSEASPGKSFIEALDHLVKECEGLFPPDDSGNELPDHLRRT